MQPQEARADYPASVMYRTGSNAFDISKLRSTRLASCQLFVSESSRRSYSRHTGTDGQFNTSSCFFFDTQLIGEQSTIIHPFYVCGQTNSQTPTCAGDPPPPPCLAKKGTQASAGLYSIGTSPTNQPAIQVCDGSCTAIFDGNSPAYSALISGVKTYYAIGKYIYTGDSCSSGNSVPTGLSTPPPDTCGANQGKATYNGKTICVDNATGTPAPTEPAPAPKTETTQKQPTVTNPDGSTSQTTTTTHVDGSTTTTVVVTQPNGSQSTTTTTTPAPNPTGTVPPTSQQDEYCKANPTAPICKAKTTCEENPDGPECKFECERFPELLACMEVGDMPEPEEPSALTKTLTFNAITLPKAGGCPAPLTLTLGGRSMSMSFEPICQYASAFYYLVMALAYLSAAYIIFGAFRPDPAGA